MVWVVYREADGKLVSETGSDTPGPRELPRTPAAGMQHKHFPGLDLSAPPDGQRYTWDPAALVFTLVPVPRPVRVDALDVIESIPVAELAAVIVAAAATDPATGRAKPWSPAATQFLEYLRASGDTIDRGRDRWRVLVEDVSAEGHLSAATRDALLKDV